MRIIEYEITQYDDGKTIEKFLKSKGYSSSVITSLKKNSDGVILNGRQAFVIVKLSAGDVLTVNITDQTNSLNITPQDCGYSVVYEDKDYLVYDKPAGVVVHPTKVYQSETLGNDFAFRCADKDIMTLFRPIYRIDKNTSGLVVIAKNRLSSATYISKEYICVCNGELPECGVFDKPIGLCEGSSIKRCTTPNGQSALTEFWRLGKANGYSVAKVIIHTGRTHQIRVHFSSAGHPLAGDTLYGEGGDGMIRHALHCSAIRFKHIVTGQDVELNSSLPADMADFIIMNDILI